MSKLFACAALLVLWGVAVDSAAAHRREARCYARTKDWRAWVERSSNEGRRQLVVAGIVTTPTGLNRRYLKLGSVIGSKHPQQVVELEIRAIADIATMAVETHEVRGRFAALPRYGSVVIRCNGENVGRVSPVDQRP